MKQQDDVMNCVFWSRDQVLAEQQKGPNFERKIGKFKWSSLRVVVVLSEFSQIFNLEFLSDNLFTDKRLCSCHMLFKDNAVYSREIYFILLFPNNRVWQNSHMLKCCKSKLQLLKNYSNMEKSYYPIAIKRLSKQPERWSRWCTLDQ